MPSVATTAMLDRLAALRTELVEQAYTLERQGRLDAADIAVAAARRIGEVCEEMSAERTE